MKPSIVGSQRLLVLFTLAALVTISSSLVFVLSMPGASKPSAEPWDTSQAVETKDFAKELGEKSSAPLTIVYVGSHTLFVGGHIPGTTFHGSASSEPSLAELKKWADALPRSTNLVIYCGCCPFLRCPNIRPAFTALKGMGFNKLRVLVMPTSFVKDWVEKGYPIQKGT